MNKQTIIAMAKKMTNTMRKVSKPDQATRELENFNLQEEQPIWTFDRL